MDGVPPSTTMLLLPALNQMFDITTTRTMATKIDPPMAIIAMLFGLELACGLLAGYSMARSRSPRWTHMIAFAVVMTAAVYVILDIEYPRLGLIRVDDFDQALVALRTSMN